MHRTRIFKIIYILISLLVFSAFVVRYTKDTQIDFYPGTDYSDSRDEYSSESMVLDKGDYDITIYYRALEDTEVSMYLDNSDTGYPAVLDKDEKEFFYEFHLDEYNDQIHYVYSVDDPKDFTLEKIRVRSDRPLYSDYLFEGFVFLILAFGILVFCSSEKMIKKTRKEKIWILLVFLSVILASIPLFSDSLFWGADAPAHAMRLEGVKDGMLNGQFPVFIFPFNNNGYGLLGFMYPNLFLYIPALMRLCGISIPLVFNSVYIFFNIATAMSCYISSEIIFEEKKEPAYLFTILYVLMPYRLVNIYTRADLPETMAMCFIPLVLAGLYLIICKEEGHFGKAVILLTIGMTGIFHSHIPSSVVILAVALLYALVFIKYIWNKRSLMIIFTSVVTTLLLNLGFIVPFIRLYFFGLDTEYYRRTVGVHIIGRFRLIELLGIHDFSTGTAWGGPALVGVAGICIAATGVILTRKEYERADRFMIVSVVLSMILFLTVPSEFPWEDLMNYKFVFPYISVMEYSFRIMLIAAPLLTLGTAYYSFRMTMKDRYRYLMLAVVLVLALICVVPGLVMEKKAAPFVTRIDGGERDSELREYLPSGASDGVFNDDRLFWSSENLIIDKYEKDGLKIGFDYAINGEGNEWIAPPLLYYPGYKAVAVTSSGEKYQLGVSQGAYYRTQIDLPAALSGSHVKMYYGGIWYFYIAYAISIITAVIFILFLIKTFLQSKAEKRSNNSNAYG